MKNFRFLISIAALLLAHAANAATYYVSYTSGSDANAGTAVDGSGAPTNPIKRIPGMTGYTGAITPVAGDIFVLQGGDTWPSTVFPWTASQSGSSGNVITYTSNLNWYIGASWSQPTLDANHTEPAGGMLKGTSRSNLTFDRLYFLNYGTGGVIDSKKAIQFDNSQQITFSRCKFKTYAWLSIYHALTTSGTYSNFSVTDCEASDTGSLMWVGVAANNVTVSGLTMSGNWIHDFSSKIGGDSGSNVHSDGLLHAYRGGANTGYVLTGIDIGYNLVTGDFRRGFGTAGGVTNFCSIEHGGTGRIYCNIIAPTPTTGGMAESWLGAGLNSGQALEYWNNVLWNTGSNPASGGFVFYGSAGSVKLRNNIVLGFQYAINMQTAATTLDSDYNTIVSTSNALYDGTGFRSYAQWQTAGKDTHSTLGTASTFVSAPTNFFPATGSNAIASGTSAAGAPTQGLASGAAWPGPARATFGGDRGPYVYSTGGGSAPTAPSGLSATTVSASQITLNWSDNSSSETGFEIERSPNGSTGWTNIATTAADSRSYDNTGLTAATTYYYRVRAVNANGASAYTSTANATTNSATSPTGNRISPSIRSFTLSVGL